MITSRNIVATPPGATIKEQLKDRQLTQKEFAARMDMSEKHISRLINGEVQLTYDAAEKLENVLGVPAEFWNNLESIYRAKIAKANYENDIDEDIEKLKMFPFPKMVKLGWVPPAKSNVDKVNALRKFFEVANLNCLNNSSVSKIACRRMSETKKGNYALLAWAQRARIEAREISTGPVDLKTLENIIPTIREMTMVDPEEFSLKLKKILADCGIALVFLPHLDGSFLHAATFYDGKKIVIGLTVRGAYADKFWFSLFHEIGHIILGHINNNDGTSEEEEKEGEADKFAADALIPPEKYNEFINIKSLTENSILNFAESVKIDPGIVVGRLQKECHIKYSSFNEMKKKYGLSS